MGCCESCFGSKKEEEAVPEEKSSLINKQSSGADAYQASSSGNIEFHEIAGESQNEKNALEFDTTTEVFEGLEVQQKFTNKSSYDTRFIWINLHSRTIHMSQYMTKDRRHKEASLTDVTTVVAGPPTKFKRGSAVGSGSASAADLVATCCLTINFKRGGGIDLLFKTEEERNLWFTTLKKIILQNGTDTEE